MSNPEDSDQTGSRHDESRVPGAAGASTPLTVVLIEDDADMRDSLQELVEGAGYHVIAYGQASRALEKLDAGLHADLLLLDLMMPGMNGWQFRLEQRARPHLRELPVIAISADSSSAAAAVDADAFIQKPFDVERLLAVMERVLLARERRRFLARSIELERLRTLGVVVAEVTHEINNPLTYSLGHIDLALKRVAGLKMAEAGALRRSLDALERELDCARDGAERVSSVVKLLSTFSRNSEEPPTAVDVVPALEAATRLAMHHIRGRAQLVRSFSPVPPVLANQARLAQVFVNLLVNAAQAVAEDAPGKHTISVATSTDGHHVFVEISDTGVGIPPETMEHIFEPFFTTKPVGEGTGLGLSISKGIIEGVGGTLSVTSVVGQGSTFRVGLPACSDQRDSDHVGVRSSRRGSSHQDGSGEKTVRERRWRGRATPPSLQP